MDGGNACFGCCATLGIAFDDSALSVCVLPGVIGLRSFLEYMHGRCEDDALNLRDIHRLGWEEQLLLEEVDHTETGTDDQPGNWPTT
jgi:hypothetical protein